MKGIDNIFIYEYATSAENVTYEVYVNDILHRTAIAYKEPNSSVIRINVSQYAKPLINVGELNLDYNFTAPKVSIKIFGETVCEEYFKMGNDSNAVCRNVTGVAFNGMYEMSTATAGNNIVCSKRPMPYNNCGDWALYYINKTGGWDMLALRGKVIETDNIDRNSIQGKDGTTVYRTVSEKTYKLNTGRLTDAQSLMIAEQLSVSRNVILHNLKDNTLKGVHITDNSIEYKQYRNSRKINNYTITVIENKKDYYG